MCKTATVPTGLGGGRGGSAGGNEGSRDPSLTTLTTWCIILGAPFKESEPFRAKSRAGAPSWSKLHTLACFFLSFGRHTQVCEQHLSFTLRPGIISARASPLSFLPVALSRSLILASFLCVCIFGPPAARAKEKPVSLFHCVILSFLCIMLPSFHTLASAAGNISLHHNK
jgi:hypothetical protein